ncbi:alpha-1,3-mannosyl-glycoprotein 4-beta-N-acetylglucosaminyltransferase A-like isoform X2 [Gordionus sp. m RMFG-2023]|uniref:alpha-1,3-mannosyl-glycoprotein 4-beta-N-acetylglucosaminyltransferase A-like isoform X2 n=1 Tax=Gordionus sp. m RMFG-2023 TaxID=3053472 RepID=UPI0031FBDE74
MIKIFKFLKTSALSYTVLLCFIIYYISKNNKKQSNALNSTKVHDIYRQLESLKVDISKGKVSDIKLNTLDANSMPCEICHVSLSLFLPHLKSIYASDYSILNPRAFIRPLATPLQKKYIVGIPSAPRQFGSYLKETLRSIFIALSREQLNDLKVIILLSGNESYINQEVRMIENDFWKQVQIGAIEIITPPDIFYPSWSNINPTLEDTPERMKWRTKQNLDIIYLMLYSYQKCDYYLQLEDDVIAKYNFLSIIDQVITNPATNEWAMLDFCPLGSIGKLYRNNEIPLIASYMGLFYLDKPIDWLIASYLISRYCTPVIPKTTCDQIILKRVPLHYTSLFQHVGVISSLEGKIQNLKVQKFGESVFYLLHTNPEALVNTTLRTYKNHNIENTYNRKSYFWAEEPKKGDIILIQMKNPVSIKRIFIKSGHEVHTMDRLYNTTLEIKLLNNKDPMPSSPSYLLPRNIDMNSVQRLSRYTNSYRQNDQSKLIFEDSKEFSSIIKESLQEGFLVIGIIDFMGSIDISVPELLANTNSTQDFKVDEVRLKIHYPSTFWVTITEIYIEEQKK